MSTKLSFNINFIFFLFFVFNMNLLFAGEVPVVTGDNQNCKWEKEIRFGNILQSDPPKSEIIEDYFCIIGNSRDLVQTLTYWNSNKPPREPVSYKFLKKDSNAWVAYWGGDLPVALKEIADKRRNAAVLVEKKQKGAISDTIYPFPERPRDSKGAISDTIYPFSERPSDPTIAHPSDLGLDLEEHAKRLLVEKSDCYYREDKKEGDASAMRLVFLNNGTCGNKNVTLCVGKIYCYKKENKIPFSLAVVCPTVAPEQCPEPKECALAKNTLISPGYGHFPYRVKGSYEKEGTRSSDAK